MTFRNAKKITGGFNYPYTSSGKTVYILMIWVAFCTGRLPHVS
jgi:hypothetical protein